MKTTVLFLKLPLNHFVFSMLGVHIELSRYGGTFIKFDKIRHALHSSSIFHTTKNFLITIEITIFYPPLCFIYSSYISSHYIQTYIFTFINLPLNNCEKIIPKFNTIFWESGILTSCNIA